MRKTPFWTIPTLALALALCPLAHAEDDGAFFVRGSLAYGKYDYEEAGASDSGNSPGAGVGVSLSKGRFLADLGIDYYQITGLDLIPDFVRTDLTATAGFRFTDWMSAFAGLRQGYQADDTKSPFSDDVWTESGYFAGAGFGPFGSERLRLSASLAYNLNEVELPTGFTFDYNGFSAKLRLGFSGTPHAAELRYQKFDDDSDLADISESYLYLAYIFNWKVGSF